jgi:ribosomal protein S18 acetylase RimI-like enzyme
MYDYILLDRSSAANYQHLTLDIFHEHLNRLELPRLIAIGATLEGQPVGLIIASYRPDEPQANILSLLVEPAYRHRGIGTALLSHIEEILTEYGCQKIDMLYNLNPTTPSLEQILKHQNWIPGFVYCERYLTDRETIMKAPFLTRYTLPEKYTIFPWSELTDRERTKIEQRDNGLDYPDILSPFQENHIDTIGSVGLRYRDEVIGWNIVIQMTSTFVYFKSQFVKSEFRSIGLGVHLLIASLQRQLLDEKATKGSFAVSVENTRMLRFVNRNLAPYLTSIHSCKKSSKLLPSSDALDRDLSDNLPSRILSQK